MWTATATPLRQKAKFFWYRLRQWASKSKYYEFCIFFFPFSLFVVVSLFSLSLSLSVYEFPYNAIKKYCSLRMNLLRQCLSSFVLNTVVRNGQAFCSVTGQNSCVLTMCSNEGILDSKGKILPPSSWENPPKWTIFSYLNNFIASWRKNVTNETLYWDLQEPTICNG